MGPTLLLLVTAAIFLMPGAFVPELTEIPIFEALVLSCLAASLPRVLARLTPGSLAADPISACVAGLAAAVPLSHLSQANLTYTWQMGIGFAKFAVFYFAIVANLDTPERLRRYLPRLALLISALAACSLLQYHGVVHLSEQLEPLDREQDFGEVSGAGPAVIRQLRGVGFFQDPNDVCLALVVGMVIAASRLADPRGGAARLLWLGPLAALAAAFPLTHSRGGLIALLAGLLAFLVARFGARRAAPLALLVLPALLLLLGGRQTAISTSGGTAQQRIQFWAIGLAHLRQRPIFGIGSGLYADYAGHDAHNSFVHSFVELGLFGGACFLGIFAHALATLHALGSPRYRVADDGLRRLRPYLLAVVAAYVGGMFSLSRVYVMPTYLVAALATAYLRAARPAPPPPRLDGRFVARLAGLSVAFLIAAQVYVRLAVRWVGG